MDELAEHIEDMAIQEWLDHMSPVTDYIYHTEKFIRKSLQFSADSRFGDYMMEDARGMYSSRAYDELCKRILEESGISDSRLKNRLYFALHGSASLFHLNLIHSDQDIRDTAEMIRMMVTLTGSRSYSYYRSIVVILVTHEICALNSIVKNRSGSRCVSDAAAAPVNYCNTCCVS